MTRRMGVVLRWAVTALFIIGIGVCFVFAVGRLDAGRKSESAEQLERSLRRAIAATYALDGAYPESLDAIVGRYGIQVDYDRFSVFYMPVGENLAPELDIVDNDDVREGGGSW